MGCTVISQFLYDIILAFLIIETLTHSFPFQAKNYMIQDDAADAQTDH